MCPTCHLSDLSSVREHVVAIDGWGVEELFERERRRAHEIEIVAQVSLQDWRERPWRLGVGARECSVDPFEDQRAPRGLKASQDDEGRIEHPRQVPDDLSQAGRDAIDDARG